MYIIKSQTLNEETDLSSDLSVSQRETEAATRE